MLTNLYPGVHVKEKPSGLRPIAGVSTSNTAFIGLFKKGPVNEAIRISSLAKFEEMFGGLWVESDTSYAVQHFFLNGGSVAWITRVIADAAPALSSESAISLNNTTPNFALRVSAKNPGTWGNNLYVGIGGIPDGTVELDGTINYKADVYDLIVREYSGTKVVNEEIYTNINIASANARNAAAVINPYSELIEVALQFGGDSGDGKRPKLSIDSAPSVDRSMKAVSEFSKSDLDAIDADVARPPMKLINGNDGTLFGTNAADPGVLTDPDWGRDFATAVNGSESDRTGVHSLLNIIPDVFSIMCLPDVARVAAAQATSITATAEKFCRDHYAFLIVDPVNTDQTAADDPDTILDWFAVVGGAQRKNSAGYFPRVQFEDPLKPGTVRKMGPSGIIAGKYAETDGTRGVFKAPAGTDTRFAGGSPTYILTNLEQEPLNVQGVNCLRSLPVYGDIIYGARTLAGADDLADEYKYIPVRRLALFIKNSMQRGLQWAVFEGNDEDLWASMRLNATAFMQRLHKDGAFQGKSATDAYFVKCDSETTTQADIDLGIVNIVVGFAPLKPAEFIVFTLTQIVKPAA